MFFYNSHREMKDDPVSSGSLLYTCVSLRAHGCFVQTGKTQIRLGRSIDPSHCWAIRHYFGFILHWILSITEKFIILCISVAVSVL